MAEEAGCVLRVVAHKAPPKTGKGRVLLSKISKAKRSIGAFSDADRISREECRRYLICKQYKSARIVFTLKRRYRIILSGFDRGHIFYRRVSFSRKSKLIKSWAMIDPASSRKFCDCMSPAAVPKFAPRFAPRFAPAFVPASGPRDECD